MDEGYEIVYIEKPEETAWEIIGRGLQKFNIQHAGEEGFQRICFALCSPNQEIVGGALGEIYWAWLHLDLMWVKNEFRGRGYGHRLLLAMEEEVSKRGAKHVFLDTFSFQAPEFYLRHGYRVFGELADFPAGHRRFFLTKELTENGQDFRLLSPPLSPAGLLSRPSDSGTVGNRPERGESPDS